MTSTAMWGDIDVPFSIPEDWSRADAHEGLHAVEVLARKVAAARIALIMTLGVNHRDIVAVVARHCALPAREARRLVNAARLMARVDGMFSLLAEGVIGIDHVLALMAVKDPVAAAELLERAPGLRPDDFVNVVQQWLVDTQGDGIRKEQKAQRSLTFYRARHGGLSMRAIFPALEGEEFRARLWQQADRAWRSAHPERAKTAGANDDETTFDQRCLDALVELSKRRSQTSNNNLDNGTKTIVLLNVSLETLQASLVGQGPIAIGDVEEMLTRAEVYGVVNDMHNIPIRFGTSKRLATVFQKLLLAARSNGRCSFEGCDRHWTNTKAHHRKRFEHGGPTDIENLELLCDAHHRHHHLVDELGDTRQLIQLIHGAVPGRGPPATTRSHDQ